jgi:hypothetical protein
MNSPATKYLRALDGQMVIKSEIQRLQDEGEEKILFTGEYYGVANQSVLDIET